MRFRKKPVVIEAIRWTGNNVEELRSLAAGSSASLIVDVARSILVHTLEGDMLANVGDWIIRGVKGELYPCKPDIFEATYELEPPLDPDSEALRRRPDQEPR